MPDNLTKKHYNPTDRPPRTRRLVEIAKQDCALAQSNLKEATSASRTQDLDAAWKQTGKSLRDTIAEYEQWVEDSAEALDVAREALKDVL